MSQNSDDSATLQQAEAPLPQASQGWSMVKHPQVQWSVPMPLPDVLQMLAGIIPVGPPRGSCAALASKDVHCKVNLHEVSSHHQLQSALPQESLNPRWI